MLSKNVIYLKRKNNLSNRSIAKLSGTPKNTIDKIIKETDYKNITIGTIMKLSVFFTVSIDDLLYEDLEQKNQKK